jgi:two-component system sensor kinase ParS
LRIGVHLLASAPPDERDAREDALDADLAELDELVEDLLLYARMTDPVREPERVAIAVADVLTRQARAEPRLELAADAVVLADPKLFRRALGNLVANARRYADARIRVTSEVCERETCVVVEDDGPGIAEPQHHEALAPFSGLDEQSGHGLGLAIVDEIVRRHGGRLTLGRSGLGGLEVRTWWPHGSG